MNNLKQVNGGAIRQATPWPDGMLAAGYKPLMWLMALLFAAVVSGCGGGSDSTAASTTPVTTSGGSGVAVDLLTAGDFTILANSAITYNGPASAVSAVTGDVAISGVAASITGFTMTQDPTLDFWTASQVAAPGKIYATDNAGTGPNGSLTLTGTATTPAKVSQASTDMTTAYNDAKNRAAGTGAFLDAGVAGNIGGSTLPPGVYTWTAPGNVTIGSDVTLGGPAATATDVWIFQIPGTLTQAAAAKVLLGGSAKAKNVFWQVAGGVTLGTTAHMEGVILSKTAITLGTGATANSRLMAQTAVTLGGTVTQPAP